MKINNPVINRDNLIQLYVEKYRESIDNFEDLCHSFKSYFNLPFGTPLYTYLKTCETSQIPKYYHFIKSYK